MLAVVDEDDLNEDDLIGLGKTLPGGHFHVTFLSSEFNQDVLEMDLAPDIKIVASAMFGDERKAIFARRYPHLGWTWTSGGEVDLGDIPIEGYDPDNLVPLEGEDPTPGYLKSADRLEIDDDMVRYCMAEVAPIVEKLTGWSGLLEGLNVAVEDGTSRYTLAETLDAQGIAPDSMEARISAWIADRVLAPGMGCALYDPPTHTIVINRRSMNQVGLDALKVMIGHELVHVGQFKYTPGLKEFVRAYLREIPAQPTPEQLEEMQAKAAYNTELEGYASYIETDYLRARHYPLATLFYHASFADKVVHAVISMMTTDEGSADASEAKASQYTDGLARYRERETRPGVPVRFSIDLSRYPGGERFT